MTGTKTKTKTTLDLSNIDPELLQHASPAQLAQYERDLQREKALLSPMDFAEYVSDGRIKRYPHTELMSAYAKALVEHSLYDDGIGPPAVWTADPDDPDDGAWRHPETGEEAHSILGISMPPQHGKTAILTETVPAWAMENNPNLRCIVTGYEANFAKGFGRKNREHIEDHPELGLTISTDSRAADNWSIKGHDGGLTTAGSGGPITGKRMDLGIIDDPVKNQEDALSEAARRSNIDWWESTFKSRMRTDTVVLIVQTRWHEGDLLGYIIENERCFYLNLPALAFEDTDDEGFSIDPDTGKRDPLGRRPGEALCPAIQTKSLLLKKRDGIGTDDEPGGVQWFSCLYQGKPNIEGSGIIAKPFYYFTTKANHSGRYFFETVNSKGERKESYRSECRFFITADLAASVRTSADWTVFSLFAWTPHGELLLVDLHRSRLESPDHVAKAEKFYRRAKTFTDGAGVMFFGVENKTFGMSLIQTLAREQTVPVRPLEADKEKVSRAIPVGMMIRDDRFFLPAGHTHISDIEKEMTGFPNTNHDDIVDTIGYAVEQTKFLPRPSRNQDKTESPQDRYLRKKRGKGRHHPIAGRLW